MCVYVCMYLKKTKNEIQVIYHMQIRDQKELQIKSRFKITIKGSFLVYLLKLK